MNILITGATGGIGEAIAKAFAEKGYNLALQYNKSEDKASEMKNELMIETTINTPSTAKPQRSRSTSTSAISESSHPKKSPNPTKRNRTDSRNCPSYIPSTAYTQLISLLETA